MTTWLTLVPNIHAALQDLILRIHTVKRENPFTPIGVLLPAASVIQDVSLKMGDTLGVQMYQFYRLGQAVLEAAGISIQEIQDTAIRRLVRNILFELFGEGKLTSFALVYDKPGFSEVLLNWVREMKSQGITPEQYSEFSDRTGNERDRQLAEFYVRYQAFMQHNNYSDADGLLWLTAEALEQDANLFHTGGPLFVLGFDQFNPVQMRILQQLSQRFVSLDFYLPWDDGRSALDPALTRLAQTRDALLRILSCQEKRLDIGDSQQPGLAHLHTTLFQVSEKITAEPDVLRLVAAPSREAEVRFMLRGIKRLLLDGISARDVAILAPNPTIYLPLVRSVASEYGLPIEYEAPLADNPAIAALIRMLHLSTDFARQATLDSLRSPYIRQPWLSLEQMDVLDQLSRERLVLSGREQWAVALAPSGGPFLDMDDEDIAKPGLATQIEIDRLILLQAGLNAFFDHLTPIPVATYRQYTAWVQFTFIGLFADDEPGEVTDIPKSVTLDMLECARSGQYPDRDCQAIAYLMAALRRLLTASEISSLDKTISWEVFRAELMEVIHQTRIPVGADQLRIRFNRLEEGRAREAEYLFVLGLSEGEFPASPAVDVLYAPGERETHPLPLIRFTTANDASLWWQVLGNVHKRLTLLRPYIDENGAPWQASPYWEAVLERFSDLQVEMIRVADYPKIEHAANLYELLAAMAYCGAQTVPKGLEELWAYTQLAQSVMQQRQSYQPPGEYEGVFKSADLLVELSRRFGEEHIWSASWLNRYAQCPFGYFAEVILRLAPREEPQDGLTAMQRGSLLHAVLEHFYRGLTTRKLAVAAANLDMILDCLEHSCTVVFAAAPTKLGFRAGVLWDFEQQELRRMLRSLAIWECEQSGAQATYQPYLQEAAFGFEKGAPALEIELEDLRFRLHGFIDRIDRDENGNLKVIDYKSGSTTYSKPDIEKGLALQTVLYALAAERNWLSLDAQVKESCFLHIPNHKSSGCVVFREKVEENELVETALHQAARSVQMIQSGIFPSAPGKPSSGNLSCRENCDFASICRVSRESIRKARRAGLV